MEGVVTAFYFDRIGNLPSWSGPKNQCRVTSKQMVINSIHPLSLSTKLVGFRTGNRSKSMLCPFLNYILANFVFNWILQDDAVWQIFICLHCPKAKFILIKPYFLFVVVRAAVSGRHLGKFLVRFSPSSANQHLRDFLFWEFVFKMLINTHLVKKIGWEQVIRLKVILLDCCGENIWADFLWSRLSESLHEAGTQIPCLTENPNLTSSKHFGFRQRKATSTSCF